MTEKGHPESQTAATTDYDSEAAGCVMDAVEWYHEVLKHDPASQVLAQLAEELCWRGQWQEAVSTCRKDLTIHPHQLRSRVLLGWALWELGQSEEAERTLHEARQELERNALLYRLLSETAKARGAQDEAQQWLDIYKRLESNGDLPLGQVETEIIELSEPEPTAPSFLDTLESLLKNYEQKPMKTMEKPELLSDADRRLLQRILYSRTL